MLGVQYKRHRSSDVGVVPYVSSPPRGSLCCNQQLSDLSRFISIVVVDENVQIGNVISETLKSYKRLPALVAEIEPISY